MKNSVQHVAIISDGNRRWARRQGLDLKKGYEAGVKNVVRIALAAQRLGIRQLTLFGWSVENWSRGPSEVRLTFTLFRRLFASTFQVLKEKGVKIRLFGEIDRFPVDLRRKLKQAQLTTRGNRGLVLNLCLNYSGRQELIRAFQEILKQPTRKIDERLISRHLYGGLATPDPEIVIRTSGEQRLSGFLTWRSVYSELFFPRVLWPDFTPRHLQQIVTRFQRRQRRFGK